MASPAVLSNQKPKFRDRNPDLPAAGKAVPYGPSAGECLVLSQRPKTPDKVRHFRGMTQPEAGKQRVFHSFAADPTTAKGISHGISTRTSLQAAHLVNPPPKSLFAHLMQEKSEHIYASKQSAPLGKSHDQSVGLLKGLDPEKTAFGLSTIKDDCAGDMVSPQKSRGQVEKEAAEGKDLYRKSHSNYDVGEMTDRNYDWSTFTKASLYGVPTPHDNSGIGVRNAMHWLHIARSDKAAQLVSERVSNFRERTQPQLGKVHDPLADTLNVEEGHTFGIMVQPDQYGTGSLIHMKPPTSYEQIGATFDPGLLSSIRHHLRKNKFYNIESLITAFLHLDKEATGVVPEGVLRDLCFQHNVPLDPDMLDLLVGWCRSSEGRKSTLLWPMFVDLINWKGQLLPVSPPLEEQMPGQSNPPAPRKEGEEGREPAPLLKQEEADAEPAPMGGSGQHVTPPADPTHYRTSSQMISSVVGALPTSKDHHTFGVPTIRCDRPAPRIRRVGDSTNYGDESDAYGLMYPSLYSNSGVYESDFFEPRSEAEIQHVFNSIGVSITDDVFQALWKEAVSRDGEGKVSVESFRAVMEELQSSQQNK